MLENVLIFIINLKGMILLISLALLTYSSYNLYNLKEIKKNLILFSFSAILFTFNVIISGKSDKLLTKKICPKLISISKDNIYDCEINSFFSSTIWIVIYHQEKDKKFNIKNGKIIYYNDKTPLKIEINSSFNQSFESLAYFVEQKALKNKDQIQDFYKNGFVSK